MKKQLRFLIDTNIFIPLQDSSIVLEESLKNFVRLVSVGRHQILCHPATLTDIKRDNDTERRERTLARIGQYEVLKETPHCPWNTEYTSPNDTCDNEILYALHCNAVHALITEDKGIHAKAKVHGLSDRVYNIQTAEDWLKRLHETKNVHLPNIQDVPLHNLSPELSSAFFDSLREDYDFDSWFQKKSQEGRHAWIYRDDHGILGAICIYAVQENEVLNDANEILQGKALKLCTLKVDEPVRGRKIGELFLKASFRYASENHCLNIFIHGNETKQPYLASLLEDFGFFDKGNRDFDTVWVKEHPAEPPSVTNVEPKDYIRYYFPHFREDESIGKYIVPIKPPYHDILFPDYESEIRKQLLLFSPHTHVGNAIKLAYLSHAKNNKISAGDILLFYRSEDEQAFTTIAIVDDFKVLSDPTEIISLVRRRTVYSFSEVEEMSKKEVKVILFRLVKHVSSPIILTELKRLGVLAGPPQSIVKLNEQKYRAIKNAM